MCAFALWALGFLSLHAHSSPRTPSQRAALALREQHALAASRYATAVEQHGPEHPRTRRAEFEFWLAECALRPEAVVDVFLSSGADERDELLRLAYELREPAQHPALRRLLRHGWQRWPEDAALVFLVARARHRLLWGTDRQDEVRWPYLTPCYEPEAWDAYLASEGFRGFLQGFLGLSE